MSDSRDEDVGGRLDALLRQSDAEVGKDAEISRILGCFKLDAYSILGLQPGCTTTDIRNTYRKLSRLIHPDKTRNPDAPEAFDVLKKAESELLDEKQRKRLDDCFTAARHRLISERRWTTDHPALTTAEFLVDWRDKAREFLIEDELDRRRERAAMMREEGREQAAMEEREAVRSRKREREKEWEETRDERVSGWRKFTGQKPHAQGAPQARRPQPPPPPPRPQSLTSPMTTTSSSAASVTSGSTSTTLSSNGLRKKPREKKLRVLG
ncbi:DnaJ sub C member 8 [Savitreella phatthalungensis]